MEKFFLIFGLFTSFSASAIVADQFQCNFEIQSINGQTVRKTEDFFIARFPISNPPSPEISMTSGGTSSKFVLNLEDEKFVANLYFYYSHASRLDNSGIVLDAMQATCMELDLTYCRDNKNCGVQVSVCNFRDPYTGSSSWRDTSLVDGIPSFIPDWNGTLERDVLDSTTGEIVGSASVSCRHRGTFY